ncbi:MAG: 6,7-dimethyl-8-ribityllumazine synthase [Spirochaetia bacterium]|nr:6,7-dimethyl-8-ribityllumazine synthase [Spirochaetota bacterium]MCX8096043.1 6,7-dimethyl-8-ribityllumazine synthase [Spirochaetota bacterium]MDW8111838.1 6,7-dimethyl-8-ribityllumazine synthase [Spirochaetia bacterium]
MRMFEGKISGKGLKIGIVCSKFNRLITDRLLDGAINLLKQVDVDEGNIDVYLVPGSFEIPVVLEKVLAMSRYDAVICLGTLIRGETPHFEYIATHVTKSILDLSVKYRIPVTFGIITANTPEEAIDRAGMKMGNKGAEAALHAIELANLVRSL